MPSGAVSINVWHNNDIFSSYIIGEYVELDRACDLCFNLKCLSLKYHYVIADLLF